MFLNFKKVVACREVALVVPRNKVGLAVLDPWIRAMRPEVTASELVVVLNDMVRVFSGGRSPVSFSEGVPKGLVCSGKLLGSGGFGSVHDGLLDGRDVAVKCIRLEGKPGVDFYINGAREAVMLSFMGSSGEAPALRAACVNGKDIFLIMDKMEFGTLKTILDGMQRVKLTGLSPAMISGFLDYLAFGLCQRVDGVHAAGVVHRDIKPGNILIGGNLDVYFGDFGLAGSVNSPPRKSGTPGYRAPELESGRSSVPGREDLYSLGVVLKDLFEYGEVDTSCLSVFSRCLGGRDGKEAFVAQLLSPNPDRRSLEGYEALFGGSAGFVASLNRMDLQRLFYGLS